MFIDFSISEIQQKAYDSLKRFPWVIGIVLVCTALSCLSIYDRKFFDDLISPKFLYCMFLGIPVSIAVSLALENHFKTNFKFKWDALLIISFLLGVCYLILPKFSSESIYKFVQLGIAAHLFVALAPFLSLKKNENLNFWSYNYHILKRILISNIYAFTFWFGILIAISTVNLLFKTKFMDAFAYSAIFIFVLFQTWFFISGVPKKFEWPVENFKYPFELRYFTQFALLPIMTIYLVIFYAYAFKILVQWNLPTGHIGWLVSTISVLGIISLLFIHPLRHIQNYSWVNLIWRLYFILILPLLGLLFLALYQRLTAYGFTESRLILLICGLTLVGLSVYFIFSKNENIKWIPFSLLFVSLITTVGPLDISRLSYNSQLQRLKLIVLKNNIVNKEQLQKISQADASELKSTIQFLSPRNGKNLNLYFEENFSWMPLENPSKIEDKGLQIQNAVIDELYQIDRTSNSPLNLNVLFSHEVKEPISFSSAKMFLPIDFRTRTNTKHVFKMKDVSWVMDLVKDKVVFNEENTEVFHEISLEKIFDYAITQNQKKFNGFYNSLPAEMTKFDFEFKGLKGQLVINEIHTIINSGERKITDLQGLILLK